MATKDIAESQSQRHRQTRQQREEHRQRQQYRTCSRSWSLDSAGPARRTATCTQNTHHRLIGCGSLISPRTNFCSDGCRSHSSSMAHLQALLPRFPAAAVSHWLCGWGTHPERKLVGRPACLWFGLRLSGHVCTAGLKASDTSSRNL